MSQRQQYAVVPREPTGDMVQAGQCYVGLFQVFTEMVKAAPPPPEQVLSAVEAHDLGQRLIGGIDPHEIVRAIERAVLTRLTESAE